MRDEGDVVADEIERKWLLEGPPVALEGAPSTLVEQGYLALGDDEVRVRRIGDRTVLTVKRGSGLRRAEVEVELAPEAYDALWRLTEGRRVQKRRFAVQERGFLIEVDVYEANLAGLVVAEVEFESEAASATFQPPSWIGTEVTGDVRYANQRLAIDGAPAP